MKPYAPPPQQVVVESVEITLRDFHGRPEAYAEVEGLLTSSAAQLVDAKQSREGRTLFIEVLEQTPRGASLLPDLAQNSPFTTKIPIELLGLEPGSYILSTNGIEAPLVVPAIQAESIPSQYVDSHDQVPNELTNELVPIEDTQYSSVAPPAP